MKHLAVDLGAGSGRVAVGAADTEDAQLDIMHRFRTQEILLPGRMHWGIPSIFNHIKRGMKAAFAQYGDEIASVSIDGWGVDYGLLDAGGDLIGLPYHYRDQRTDSMRQEISTIISDRELYRQTGVQLMQINTLFQLYAYKQAHPHLLAAAQRYLSIPDLLTYWLCGKMANERTHASTTQLFSPASNTWALDLMDKIGLPSSMFGEIIPSGTVLGPLLSQVREEVGAGSGVVVIAGAGHDTQAAAFTVPAREDTAFLSCGTWSVMGIEGEAVINDKSFAVSASNEASARGNYNLLKNILGLWLLQECKTEWDQEDTERSITPLDYAHIIEDCRGAEPPSLLININDEIFLKSHHQAGSMQDRIDRHLVERGGKKCSSRGQTTLLILESLAELYATTLNELENISGRDIKYLHLIGGGAQNDLLCKFTQERSGTEVVIGHPEATAYGNILIQHAALYPAARDNRSRSASVPNVAMGK